MNEVLVSRFPVLLILGLGREGEDRKRVGGCDLMSVPFRL